MKKDITRNGTKNAERNKREGYRKKKQSVPPLPIKEARAAKAFQDYLNRVFVKIMYENGLSAEDMAERLYPCVSESSIVYKIIAKTRKKVKSDSKGKVTDKSKSTGNGKRKGPDRRNITIAILAALRYAFGLDINKMLDELLEEVS